jgi:lysophospholipase L1-like esterase
VIRVLASVTRPRAVPGLVAALLAAFALLIALRPGVSVSAPGDPVRIMPLGDSITGSPGCWRALLWNQLQNAGYTNIDFVGTLPPQGCGVPYDGDNEGHGGILATNMANQSQLPPWLAATHPDIVIMHLGTNDVWSNLSPDTILTAFSTLVGQMRASNPAMKVLVAQIIPMNPSSCPECAQRVVAFNAAIPAWAAGISTAQSPVSVVDQWTGFNDATDTGDGVHPNDAGNQKMAARWFPPLSALLTPGTPPTSDSPTPTPTSTGGGGGARCTAAYRIDNQWQGGFQATVAVTDSGTAALTGWTVTFSFANGQAVTQSWSAAVTQTGAAVTARNMSYNGALAPAATTSFGFLASWNGTNTAPAVACAAT